MTREQIIAQVLAKIDEVSPLAQEQEFSPAGTIDAIMNESVSNMLRNAPLHLLTPVKINTEGANFVHDTNADGTGRIALPSNFIRLYSFKMQAWSRPVEKTISVANPLYKLQHNPVTRGKSQKPVVALSYHNTGTGVDDPNIGIYPPVEGWNAIPPIYINDETIYHGSEAGQMHIPAGGELNQILAFGSPSGVAVWSAMTDSIHGNRGGGFLHDLATEQTHGFMSSYDKAKLNTIQQGANYYEHPNQQGFKHIPQGGQVKDMLVWSAPGTAVWIDPATILELKIEQGDENEFFSWDKTWRQIDYSMLSGAPPEVDLSNYVTKDGTETISGAKYFTSSTRFVSASFGSGTYKSYIIPYPTLLQDTLFVLPPDNGSSGFILSTDGSGNTIWISPPSTLTKATSSDVNTGTDDAKYVTSLSIRNSNVFSAEKSGQFSSLTEKTSITANDAFVIEDATGGVKQLLKWSRIKAYNDLLYYGAVSSQFYATSEKVSLASNDRLIMEDSSASYVKKSFKWSTVRTTLDAIYYGNIASQFYATSEKTTLAGHDRLIIEDSEATYGKKSIKWSLIVSTIGAGGTSTTLDGLSDVTITSPSSGHVLQYNGSQWVNATVSGTSHDRLHAMTSNLDHSMSSARMIGRITAGTGAPEELTSANVLSFIGVTSSEWKNENITKSEIEAKLTGVITSHEHNYDNYQSWSVAVSGVAGTGTVSSGSTVTFQGTGGTSISRSGNTVIINSSTASGGIPEVSSGVNTRYLRGRDASGNAAWFAYSAPSAHDAVSMSGATVSYLTLNESTQAFTIAKIPITDINASGTPTSTTFLRGDGAWVAVTPGGSYSFTHSLSESSGNVTLVNDSATPGNSKYYGTNTSGERGWYDYIPGTGDPYELTFMAGSTSFDVATGSIVQFTIGIGIALSYTDNGSGSHTLAYRLDANLTQLNDVEISSPMNNQILRYNGTTWVNSVDTAYSWGDHAAAGYLESLTVDGIDNGITIGGTAINPTLKIVSINQGGIGQITVTGSTIGVTLGTTDTTAAAGNHTHTQLHDRSHAITSTNDHTATAHRLFYSNASGQVVELAFGTNKQLLMSNGASSAPSFVNLSSLDAFTYGSKGLVPAPSATEAATETRFLCADGSWSIPTGTGTGMTNPMTTTGDIIYRSSSQSATRLGIGEVNQVLSVSSTGIPEWKTLASTFVMNITGDIVAGTNQVSTLQNSAVAEKPLITSLDASDLFLVSQDDALKSITAGNIQKYIVPFTAKGQLLYGGESGAVAVLPANTTTTRTILSQVSSNTSWIAHTFNNLNDTAVYGSGNALNLVRVNGSGTGLEYMSVAVTSASALRIDGTVLSAKLQNETSPVLGGNLNANTKSITALAHVIPSLSAGVATYDLGSGTNKWRVGYIDKLVTNEHIFLGNGTSGYYAGNQNGDAKYRYVEATEIRSTMIKLGTDKFAIRYNGGGLEFLYNNVIVAEMTTDGNMIFMKS